MSDVESWIALSLVPEIGLVTFRKLLSVFGDPGAVFDVPRKKLSAVDGVGEKRANNIKNFSGWKGVEKQLKQLNRCNARAITFLSDEYPVILHQVQDAPVLLYVKGTIL
ncbi:MAG TPA: helix-hairpin-helix domain-containing protein, partial [Thermodesulfovibrionales bacterium]|nr:helix-hairpin-helix domain-containing protein [Thermodesulfovibrionales bacterium]